MSPKNAPRARWLKIARGALLVGCILLVAGFVVHDVRRRGHAVAYPAARFLLVAGAVLALAGLLANLPSLLRALASARGSERANFGLVVVLTLVLAGAGAFITARRSVEMNWRVRLQRPLNFQTIEVLQAVGQEVEITLVRRTLFFPEDRELMGVMKLTREMLALFQHYNQQLKLADLNWESPQNQDRMQKLVQSLGRENLPELCLIVRAAGQQRVIPFSDLIGRSRGQYAAPDSFRGESVLAGAIAELALDESAARSVQEAARPREIDFITLSPSGVLAARYLFIGGLPGAIVLVGVVVWVRRRR